MDPWREIDHLIARRFGPPRPPAPPSVVVRILPRSGFDPDEPRDESGRWTEGGGGGGNGGAHPGRGYSEDAWVDKDGVIHTDNVYDATRALYEDREVELKQPDEVATLIDHLGEVTKKMIELGAEAPRFNLCNVSVEGTNLFCTETKDIPRIELPQLDAKQTKAFRQHLKDLGYDVTKGKEYASHLRATQNELDGAKAAKIADKIRKDPEEGQKRIIVSRDNYILDGHHHWAARLGLNAEKGKLDKGEKMRVARVDIGIIKLLKLADQFTGGKGKKKHYLINGCGCGNLATRAGFDPDEPRDEHGQWTEGGGSGEGGPAEGSGPGGAGPGSAGDGRLSNAYGRRSPTAAEAQRNVAAVHSLDAEHTDLWHRLNRTPTDFHELLRSSAGSQQYHDAIAAAAKANEHGAAVEVKPAEDYTHMHTFATPDGKAGFALDDDNIVSLFKHPDSSARKIGLSALALATQLGGRRLDAFDTELPHIYSNGGFRAVARLAWNDAYAPPNWDYKKFGAYNNGRPDIVFMVHDPEYARAYKPGDGERVATYDEGVAAQNAALAAIAKRKSFHARAGFDPDEPRDESGRWTEGGGSGGGEAVPAPSGGEVEALHPDVVNVGGDQWNKETAKRLEREYQAARPKVDKLAQDAVAAGETQEEPSDEEDQPYVPESWDELSADQQSDASNKYVEKTTGDYYDSEVNNWQDSGGALDEAKSQLANETMFGSGKDHDEWAIEAIDEYKAQREEEGKDPIPFDTQTLMNAIGVGYEGDGEGGNDPDISFDDDKLQHPEGYDPAQMTLPGIEPKKPEEMLTEDMRDDITKALTDVFNKKADNMQGDMDPPDYLHDNAAEFAAEDFEHNMKDSAKFEWVKNNTDIIEEPEQPTASTTEIKMPETFDPLNKTSGTDYKRTQALARYLSIQRAKQVLAERGLGEGVENSDIAAIDHELWDGWKASSSGDEGQLLQVAIADELGGRLRITAGFADQMNRDEIIAEADKKYASIGGYAGVKAYVRAKWETTQYLLDKADINKLELYRGIRIDQQEFNKSAKHYAAAREIGNHKQMPTLEVVRNGAASTTVSPSVANDWGHHENRVVLRAEVPRTAVVSVPAYGINIHSEREVVVAGTAWKGWDAWARRAPTFDEVPLKEVA